MDVEQQVKKIICEQLGVEESEVTRDASFVETLNADLRASVRLAYPVFRSNPSTPHRMAGRSRWRQQTLPETSTLRPVHRRKPGGTFPL